MSTKRVADANIKKERARRRIELDSKAIPMVFSKKTEANWPWASERAHRRR